MRLKKYVERGIVIEKINNLQAIDLEIFILEQLQFQ